LIELNQIHYRYSDTPDEWVLRGVDLFLNRREYVFILGASGSGKSTLGYLFNGLIPHFFEGTLHGSVAVNGSDTRDLSVADLFPHVGLVLQNADAQLFNSTVENEISYGLESLGLPASEIDRQIRWVTEMLHIEDLLDRSPMALSGGEKRLVAIASMLCLNPPMLLLDEPYAHLDWEGTRRVRDALRQVHQSGKTVVVIEQRVGGFLQDGTRCIIVDQGTVIFDGSPGDARAVLVAERLVPNYPPKKARDPLGPEPALVARGLGYETGNGEILKEASLEIKQGETVAIVGRNGAGKTTLIKHFNGLLRPTRGTLSIMGEGIRGKAASRIASTVGISFQNPNDQFFKYRVRDELLVGLRILGEKHDEWLEEICGLFDLHGLLDRSPYRLSEGQKRRVALASILAMRPTVLVLDEPTAGQDARFLEALAGLLISLEQRGFTTLIVTHDLDFARATAERWIVLHDGRVVGDGLPEELVHDERLIRMGAMVEPEEEVVPGFFEVLRGER
jgi:energy-coupling factor transport system ATP-binding protein